MFGFTFITVAWIESFLLVLLRIVGLVAVSPVLGRKNLPAIFKAGLCFLLSILVMSILPTPQTSTDNLFQLFAMGLSEILFGMILGFISLVVFYIAVSAGQFIDMQIGFGMSNFFDPSLNMQVPISGGFLNIIMMLIFFSVNGHHQIIQMLFNSFTTIAPGNVVIQPAIAKVFIDFFIWFFIIVLKVTAPIIAVSVIIEVSLGILVKTMPQFNVFVLGVPLKIFMGLLVLVMLLSVFVGFLENVFDQMLVWYDKIMQGLVIQ